MTPLVLFDFDGTLTKSDSFIRFIIYSRGMSRFLAGLIVLSPVLLCWKLGIIRNSTAKEAVFSHFFKRTPVVEFNKVCEDFAEEVIPGLLRSTARDKLMEHLDGGHHVVLISASPENYLNPWCKKHNIGCIGTRLEIKDGLLTGKIDGLNCYGVEKVIRLKKRIDLDGYKEIYAYGDSAGDKDMLSIATKPFYRTFA